MKQLAITLALLGLLGTPARAVEPTYEQWAENGAKMYSAFRCAALAEAARKPDEFKRLFNIGAEAGRPLLNAIFDGRVKGRSDLWIVPLGLIGCGQGPSAEFVLGRMWQCSQDDAMRFIKLEDSADKRIARAADDYTSGKCAEMQGTTR